VEAVAIFAALAFAINKTVSVIKALFNGDKNTVVTQAVVWAVGFGGLSLAAHAAVTEAYALPGFTESLGSLDAASLGLLAWLLGSTGSFAFDLKKAIDGSDSAAEASLVQ
jgi:hypothetical protein